MITPDNQIPIDDQDSSEADDQRSQTDIHNNGLDDVAEEGDTTDYEDPSSLQRAYDAAEPSYTLNLGEDDGVKDDEE